MLASTLLGRGTSAIHADMIVGRDPAPDAMRLSFSRGHMRTLLKMRRDGARGWLLCDTATGIDIGGIDYVHAGDGNHYRAWLYADGARRSLGSPLPQLAMAARAVELSRP